MQLQLREEAREAWLSRLPDGQFRRISLADVNATGKWQDGGRECWYKGHLYDVIKQKDIGGKTYLFCLDDEREARLIDQSAEITRANAGQEQAQENSGRQHARRNPQDHPGRKSTPQIGDFLFICYHTGFLLRDRPVTWSRSRSSLPEYALEIAPRPPWTQSTLKTHI